MELSKKKKVSCAIKSKALRIITPLIFSSLERTDFHCDRHELRRFGKEKKKKTHLV